MCVFLLQISILKALVRQKRTKGTLAKCITVFPDGGSKHILSGQACSRERTLIKEKLFIQQKQNKFSDKVRKVAWSVRMPSEPFSCLGLGVLFIEVLQKLLLLTMLIILYVYMTLLNTNKLLP